MKRVAKLPEEPAPLSAYKDCYKNAPRLPNWKEFKGTAVKQEVQKQLREDQRGLCAYCENELIPEDESVEHFIARDADHSKELDWNNLLLCCAGGSRPLPEDVEDADVRYDPHDARTCGHAKLGSRELILNPRDVPAAPRLFRFKSLTGEIEPDEAECQRAGIAPALANRTISVLNLHAGRLNRARLSILVTLEEELGGAGSTVPLSFERERELAMNFFPTAGPWPAFFTTLRFSLGDGAEAHLASLNYQG